jgi:uncharacterized protein DUF4192
VQNGQVINSPVLMRWLPIGRPRKPGPMTESQPHEPHSDDPQPRNRPADDRQPPGSQTPGRPLRGRPQDPDAVDPRTTGLRCRVRVGSADGVLAVVPHLLGFHPADSLVMLGVGGPHARIRVTFRYDLPDPPDSELALDIAEHAVAVLRRQDLLMAIAIGYGPGRTVTPVVDGVVDALRKAGIAVHDVLRVEGGKYWSYLCGDPQCCPPDGVPFDASAHPASAALAAAGMTVRPDRAALADTLAAAAELAQPMREAVQRARQKVGNLLDFEAAAAGGDPFQRVADCGRRSVKRAIARYRQGGELTDHDEIAWLGVALGDLRVRDDAWARMDPRFNEAHQRLWVDLIRHLPADVVAAPAALLAFTAWQAGDGALASVAIERALEADPEYSMALLIADALHAGLPPSVARLPMTPKQVAASYARRRRERRGDRVRR